MAGNATKKTNTVTQIIVGLVVGIVMIIGIFVLMFSSIIGDIDKEKQFIQVLATTMDEEQIQEAKTVLKNCELEEGIITRDELLDGGNGEGSLGYRITKDGNKTVMYILDGKISCIKYADKYLYNNGEYLSKLSDYIITFNEKADLVAKCQNSLNAILKAPSTAKYPWDYNEWKMQKEDGIITVQSYVDAQNGFGAMIRSTFQFKIKNNEIISLIFDGTEYIK